MRKILKGRRFSVICILIFILIFLSSVNIFAVAGIEEGKNITILFTADMHDHLLPVKDEQNGVIINSGGFARLQSAINSEKKNNSNTLLLDAGDFSMGTPFQTMIRSDSPELRIMGKMGYDVVTFGNHEYDYRAAGLADSLSAAQKSGDKLPQIVQSNVTFPTDQDGNITASLQKLKQAYGDYGVKDYTIIAQNGISVGIFGLIGEDAASNAPMSEVKFPGYIENAQRVVKILKQQENVDLIICLSHCGIWTDKSVSEDEILAREVPEINVILSAHTHTKLSEPIIIGKTIIGSVEGSCKYLGVINISRVENADWQLDGYRLQQIDDRLPDDPAILESVNQYKKLVQEKYFNQFNLGYDDVLAASPFNFQPVNKIIKTHQEDPLGNLISDAYIYAVKKAEGADYVPVDAAVVPVGTIRGSFFQGNITVADVFSASSLGMGPDNVPGYPLISVYLTGKELKNVCEVDASVTPMMEDAQLFISGISFKFNPNRLIFNKVTDASLQRADGSLEEIVDSKLYRLVASLYSAQMLSAVGDKSYGLLSIVPKTWEGIPITNFEAHVIKDTANGNNFELKEWLATTAYLQSFDKVNGIAQIPPYYKETHGRKIIDNNKSIIALLGNPNGIALTVYTIVIAVFITLVIIVIMIIRKIRNSARRMSRK